jgi:hypothetical protein
MRCRQKIFASASLLAGGAGGGRAPELLTGHFALRSLGRGLLGPNFAFGHLRLVVRELAFQLSTIQD